MYNTFDEDVVPKYKKRTNSNVSSSSKKSDHKHEYKEVLIFSKEDEHFYRANKCTICGKLADIKFFETEKEEGKPYSKLLDHDEVYNKYKDKLEVHSVDSIWKA